MIMANPTLKGLICHQRRWGVQLLCIASYKLLACVKEYELIRTIRCALVFWGKWMPTLEFLLSLCLHAGKQYKQNCSSTGNKDCRDGCSGRGKNPPSLLSVNLSRKYKKIRELPMPFANIFVSLTFAVTALTVIKGVTRFAVFFNL
jgi:hypothetical protein